MQATVVGVIRATPGFCVVSPSKMYSTSIRAANAENATSILSCSRKGKPAYKILHLRTNSKRKEEFKTRIIDYKVLLLLRNMIKFNAYHPIPFSLPVEEITVAEFARQRTPEKAESLLYSLLVVC